MRQDATSSSQNRPGEERQTGTGIRSAAPLTPLAIVQGYDRIRRQRLVRMMTLGVAGLTLVLLPSVFFPTLDSVSLGALLIVLVGSSVAYLLNRVQQVSAAGYFLLGGGTAGVAWVIALRALQQGLTTTDLRLYDFFVLPIVLSGVIANRRMPILLGCLTGVFTLLTLLFLPHATDLQLYWEGRDPQTLGSVYDVIAIPLVIQGLTAAAAWLGADSVRRSLLSATRADELTLANERIVSQARELERRDRQLRDGMAHLQQVHTAFARGNYDTRAHLNDRELQPLAVSLNQLLMQMQRLLREQGQRSRIEMAAGELVYALRRLRAGGGYVSPAYTGTAFDEVLLELVTAHQQGLLTAPPTTSPRSYPGTPPSSPSGALPWWEEQHAPGT